MRLNQYLAKSTSISRRQADQTIQSGQVEINQRRAGLGDVVRPSDQVFLSGRLLKLPLSRYIMLNKPAGYICSRRRQGAAQTIYELLPTSSSDLKPIGRLDKDSSGLVILTNDGNWANQLAHPSQAKLKQYRVKLDRALTEPSRTKLTRGIQLSDGPSLLILKGAGTAWRVELAEGRNRQIRRSFGALGYRVLELHRFAIGPIQLGKLAPGQWRDLTSQEVG